jgi:chromate reductase, NAD(P)H dehydrogenase (quinone)
VDDVATEPGAFDVTRRVMLICGSLRSGSTNEALLRTVANLLPVDVVADSYDGMGQLPHFNPDDDHDPLPPAVADLRIRIAAADAILFSTPEYAGAMPGSFKNLLDWTVGGVEISEKPTAWINISTSPAGAAGTHESLTTVLRYTGAKLVDAACLRVPVHRDAVGVDGLIFDPEIRLRIAAAVNALLGQAV